VGWLDDLREHLDPFVSKTNLGILRWLHFMCLVYLASALLKGREQILEGRLAAPLVKTGQQSLPVFLTGMWLSYISGMALDLLGRSILTTALVNMVGVASLILLAYLMAWFKSQPWRGRARR
jgi:hypothetical protein